MKYYVLWTLQNPIILDYLDKYELLLEEKLKDLSNVIISEKIKSLLSKKNKKDFIINPDNSSLINFLYFEFIKNITQYVWDKNEILKKFEKEIDLFLAEKYEDMVMNKGTLIWNTNIRLTNIDNNVYGTLEAHPDHKANWWVIWYWEREESDWLKVYEKTFELLKNTDLGSYDELNLIIKKIIPLGTARWLHNSASYKECVWHLYMWYTIDSYVPELNNLEAIIHESSHNKLNLIKHFDKLILNDLTEKYYSPYRPDARHISWIYLWIHAFVPVIYILAKAISEWLIKVDENWREKILLYYIKNKFSLKVLKKYWKFTELWNEILDEVIEVMSMTDPIIKNITYSKENIKRVSDVQGKHFRDVNLNYPKLEY